MRTSSQQNVVSQRTLFCIRKLLMNFLSDWVSVTNSLMWSGG